MSENTEVKTRQPSKRILLIEVYDKEGNVIEGAKADVNLKIVGDYKKIDETVVDVIKDHPNAFFIKL
jgi:hypothetical protein